MTLPALVVLALLVGALIGCIGVGGVLLVPALVYVAGIDVHVAVASCMFCYLFTGVVALVEFSRGRSIRWRDHFPLFAGAIPGAFAGAFNLTAVPADALELAIVALILFSGYQGLRSAGREGERRNPASASAMVLVGFLTGAGSSLSGTGGPLLLLPVLMWLGTPPLIAVGLSQVFQLPVAASATAGNLIHGSIDFTLALTLALPLSVGVVAGARLAHRLPGATLRRAIATALLAVGVLLLFRVAAPLFAGGSIS